MANRFYTLLLVPERSAAVRRIQVPKAMVLALGAAGLMVGGLMISAAVHYGYVIDQVFENRQLKAENQRLRPPELPRPPSFRTVFKSTFVVCSA